MIAIQIASVIILLILLVYQATRHYTEYLLRRRTQNELWHWKKAASKMNNLRFFGNRFCIYQDEFVAKYNDIECLIIQSSIMPAQFRVQILCNGSFIAGNDLYSDADWQSNIEKMIAEVPSEEKIGIWTQFQQGKELVLGK